MSDGEKKNWRERLGLGKFATKEAEAAPIIADEQLFPDVKKLTALLPPAQGRVPPVAADSLAKKLKEQREAAEKHAMQRVAAAKAKRDEVKPNEGFRPIAKSDLLGTEKMKDYQPAYRPVSPIDPNAYRPISPIDAAYQRAYRPISPIAAAHPREGVPSVPKPNVLGAAKAILTASVAEPIQISEPSTILAEQKVLSPHVASTANKNQVFVVHGRDHKATGGLYAFLRAIGITPVEFSKAISSTLKAENNGGNPHIDKILTHTFEKAAALIVLLTPDDQVSLRPALHATRESASEKKTMQQARPNVLFEAGMAFARHPTKTIFVAIGNVKPFSDFAGKHLLHLDNSTKMRRQLAKRLEAMGCHVDLDGDEWETAGDIEITRRKTTKRLKKNKLNIKKRK